MRINLANPGALPQMWEVVLQFRYALEALGHKAEISTNVANGGPLNIFFGSQCLSPESTFPPDSIIYNLEQFGSNLFHGSYGELLRKNPVIWDYSAHNTEKLAQLYNISAKTVFPGYVPQMSCLNKNMHKNIDVLFYGVLNERRRKVLSELVEMGLRVENFSGYGRERDYAISRSWLVMNIHYYNPAILEVSRLGYLWANHVPVISEKGLEESTKTFIPAGLEQACAYVPYEKLSLAAKNLLSRPAALERTAAEGYAAFSQTDLIKTLRMEIGEAIHPGGFSKPSIPDILNIGSGKNFIKNALNIDIQPSCNPDLVLDISARLDAGRIYPCQRFQEVKLKSGMFKKIIAHDVLQDVKDLKTTMDNLLFLLHPGGELQISVPYDLSLGAWQSPDRQHAFNEKSWLYYTDWFWYMGWKDYRFDLHSLEFVPSATGSKFLENGKSLQEILSVPRAIDSMKVKLIKRSTTEAEKMEYCLGTNSLYKGHKSLWDGLEKM